MVLLTVLRDLDDTTVKMLPLPGYPVVTIYLHVDPSSLYQYGVISV